MAQQTAVEWFSEQVFNKFNEFHIEHISIIDFRLNMIKLENQAKAMEKEQIKNAMIHALDVDGHNGGWIAKFIEDYYTKTFTYENND